MRRIYTLLMLLSIFLYSCDDFLEYKQGDILIPKTTENFKEFIYGEIIKESGGKTIRNLEFMTDNVQEAISANPDAKGDLRSNLWGYYTWQRVPEKNNINELLEDNIWANQYHKILSCNTVLDNLETMIGSENEKNVVKAEALFMRAYAYLILANTYAKPYTTEEEAKLPRTGVPINTSTGIEDNLYTRFSLFSVYKLIEDDLKESIDLFSRSSYDNTIFRPGIDAARLILSRAYLYQKKYRECKDISSELIANSTRSIADMREFVTVIETKVRKTDKSLKTSGVLASSVRLSAPPPPPPPPPGPPVPPPPPPPPGPGPGPGPDDGDDDGNEDGEYEIKTSFRGHPFFVLKNTGIIFTYGEEENAEFVDANKYYYKASDELMELYVESDYRNAVGWGIMVKTKPWKFMGTDVYDKCLRIEEAYLNRAEALVELNEGDLGKSDIHTLRNFRIHEGIGLELDMSTQEKARKAIREERRRELCFEYQRWFDLRRWMDKEIVHTYTIGSKTVTYTLEKNSEAYTLPIPQKVLLQNDVIQNVNRPQRNND